MINFSYYDVTLVKHTKIMLNSPSPRIRSSSRNDNSAIMSFSAFQSSERIIESIFCHWVLLNCRSYLVPHCEPKHVVKLNAIADFDTENVDALKNSWRQWNWGCSEVDGQRGDIPTHRHQLHVPGDCQSHRHDPCCSGHEYALAVVWLCTSADEQVVKRTYAFTSIALQIAYSIVFCCTIRESL